MATKFLMEAWPAQFPGLSGNDRDSYLRELEKQIAEQRARKEEEKKHKLDWWEKPVEPQFQVNPPQRPHPSQVSWKSKTKL